MKQVAIWPKRGGMVTARDLYNSSKLLRSGSGTSGNASTAVRLLTTGIGNCSGSNVDKFDRFNLTALPALKVKAPLIGQCLANIECRIVDDTLADKYDLHILEALAISYDDDRKERRTLHHNGDGTFTVDGRTIDLKTRMVKWKAFQVDL